MPKRARSGRTAKRSAKRAKGSKTRKSSKKTMKKSKKYNRKVTKLPTIRVMPDRVNTVLVYHGNFADTAITTGANAVQNIHTIRNSCFDPDQTGTGHQPKEFDFWSTIYKFYNVWKITVTYNIYVGTVANGLNGYGLMYIDAFSAGESVASEAHAILESNRYKKKRIQFTNDFNPNPRSHVRLSRTIYPNQLITSDKKDDQTYWTAVGSNPDTVREVDMQIRFANISPILYNVNNGTIGGDFTIKMYTTLTDKVLPNQD